mmetsp:Transcript_6642/g.15777  ORF Transcript_6642/g.15777 Transcript_6642/m.15777 type:complete len:229 (-) Transcript_6642:209-895(-)
MGNSLASSWSCSTRIWRWVLNAQPVCLLNFACRSKNASREMKSRRPLRHWNSPSEAMSMSRGLRMASFGMCRPERYRGLSQLSGVSKPVNLFSSPKPWRVIISMLLDPSSTSVHFWRQASRSFCRGSLQSSSPWTSFMHLHLLWRTVEIAAACWSLFSFFFLLLSRPCGALLVCDLPKSGEYREPCRARPLPFCCHGFLPFLVSLRRLRKTVKGFCWYCQMLMQKCTA